MKASRWLSVLLLAFLVALLAPLGAAAKPPEHPAPLAPLPSVFTPLPQIAGAHLVVTRLTSAPAGARAGHAYVLRGTIVNAGGAAVHGRVVVHLLRVGSRPLAVGATRVAPRGAPLRRVRRPHPAAARAAHGSYAIVACAQRAGRSGAFGCVTAERHLQIGPRRAVAARPRRRPARARLFVRRALAVVVRGPRLSGDRQRRLHEPAHRRLPQLRRRDQPVPAGDARRPHRPGDAVPDGLQPRLRADVSEHEGRPEHDRRLGARERPAGELHVRAADVSRRPERPERSRSARARGRRRSPRLAGRRTTRYPPACSPELLSTNPNKRFSLDGTQCPANKLVITPSSPIPSGASFVVQVNYTGRPGVHNDGDGTTEGWFRVEPARRRGRLRHDRAGRDRGLDAAEQPSERQADVRLLRHRARSARPRSPTASSSRRRRTCRTRTSRAARRRGTGTRPRASRRTWSRTASARTT